MYLYLFGCSKPFRYATWAIAIFVTGYLGCNIITLIFGCTPIPKYWNPHEPGHCITLVKADHAYGSMNVVSDVLLFLLPLPMVWQLKLTTKEKLGIFAIFMGGILYVALLQCLYIDGLTDLQQLRRNHDPVFATGRESQGRGYGMVRRKDVSLDVRSSNPSWQDALLIII